MRSITRWQKHSAVEIWRVVKFSMTVGATDTAEAAEATIEKAQERFRPDLEVVTVDTNDRPVY